MYYFRTTKDDGHVVTSAVGTLPELKSRFNKETYARIEKGAQVLSLQGGGSVTLSCQRFGAHVYTQTLQRNWGAK